MLEHLFLLLPHALQDLHLLLLGPPQLLLLLGPALGQQLLAHHLLVVVGEVLEVVEPDPFLQVEGEPEEEVVLGLEEEGDDDPGHPVPVVVDVLLEAPLVVEEYVGEGVEVAEDALAALLAEEVAHELSPLPGRAVRKQFAPEPAQLLSTFFLVHDEGEVGD